MLPTIDAMVCTRRPGTLVECHVQKDASYVEKSITLPESLYWEYVRPFTPITDRVVVSKRCSTRYHAGKRVDLDESYLKTFERDVGMRAEGFVHGDTSFFYNIPIARGVPGTNNFCIDFRGFKCDDTDPAQALEMLRRARSAWDEHLYQIPSPSARLHACLKILHMNGSCPSLFIGKGEIADVVTFHAEMNPLAINGPVVSTYRDVVKLSHASLSLGRNVYPNTQLGYWVARFVSSIMMGFQLDDIIYSYANNLGSIVKELLYAGADVSPFFEPLHSFPRYKFSALTVMSRYAPNFFKRGMSMYDVMEKYSCWLYYQGDFARGNQIGMLLDRIQAKLDYIIVHGGRIGSSFDRDMFLLLASLSGSETQVEVIVQYLH